MDRTIVGGESILDDMKLNCSYWTRIRNKVCDDDDKLFGRSSISNK